MVPQGDLSSDFDFFASAQVTVIETDTGRNMPVNNVHRDTQRFGLANFLSWMVEGWEYDVPYTVTIRNIRMMGGGTRGGRIPGVGGSLQPCSTPARQGSRRTAGRKVPCRGRFNTPRDEDGYAILLNQEVSVTGSSEFANWGFYVMVYDSDKKLVISSDEPFSMKFPWDKLFGDHQPLQRRRTRCYRSTKPYTVMFN